MGSPKKAKAEPGCSDRISTLPKEIKECILSNLNVQEAVRASILSSAWRNVWTTMPDILLYDWSFASSVSHTTARSKFITLVDLALALHKGSLDTFILEAHRSFHDVIDRWISMLSKKVPKAITIKFASGPKFKIHSSLFSISDLKHLRVKYCIITLPRKFEGFKRLVVLNLKSFFCTDSDISYLISSCPMLNTLRLKYFEGINCLNIQAPVLEVLEVEGQFEDLHLNAPSLLHAYLTLDKTEAHKYVPVAHDGKRYLMQVFGSLVDVKTLIVSGSFLTYLSKGCLLTKLPGAFHRLEKIGIERCFWNWTEALAICSIFENARMLRELEIWSYPREEVYARNGVWDQDETAIQKPPLDHLSMVTINEFRGLRCEVSFLGMLLSWAPALEELKIHRVNDEDDDSEEICMCKALMRLLALPRVSPKAKVIVT